MQLVRPPNTHTARILRFADGDTVVLLVKATFGIHVEKYVRLEGIESFELNGPDRARAESARATLDTAFADRICLLHVRSHRHDKYARLIGSVTVGETDLATEIVKLGHAWHCTAKQSAAQHAAKLAPVVAALAATVGCVQCREGATLVYAPYATNVTVDVASQWAQTVSQHPYRAVLIGLVVIAVVAAIVWVIHHRAYLIGKLAGLAAAV